MTRKDFEHDTHRHRIKATDCDFTDHIDRDIYMSMCILRAHHSLPLYRCAFVKNNYREKTRHEKKKKEQKQNKTKNKSEEIIIRYALYASIPVLDLFVVILRTDQQT